MMAIFRRWRLWFRRVRHELGQSWYCWRHGVVRLGESLRVHSVTFGKYELLAGVLPGTSFGINDWSGCDRVTIVEGETISIEVENLSSRALPFQGAVFTTDRHGSMVHPFAPLLLAPRQRTRVSVRVTGAGKLDRIMIPTHVRKS